MIGDFSGMARTGYQNAKDTIAAGFEGWKEGFLDNIQDVAIARLLSLTPFVGYIGNVIFLTSRFKVRTFNALGRKLDGSYTEHQVINGKPVPEFLGVGLKEYGLEIALHSFCGVEPLTDFERLEKFVETGEPQVVFLHGRNEGLFSVRSIEADETHWYLGRPAVMNVTLVLKEYVESVPVEAQQKLREEELNRGDTGLGGPLQLAGHATLPPEVTEAPRTLTPVKTIHPETRMEIEI